MIWAATFGSGATTGIRVPITVPVLRIILQVPRAVRIALFAAATGTTMPMAAALRAGPAARRRLATATTDFVLSWPIRGEPLEAEAVASNGLNI